MVDRETESRSAVLLEFIHIYRGAGQVYAAEKSHLPIHENWLFTEASGRISLKIILTSAI